MHAFHTWINIWDISAAEPLPDDDFDLLDGFDCDDAAPAPRLAYIDDEIMDKLEGIIRTPLSALFSESKVFASDEVIDDLDELVQVEMANEGDTVSVGIYFGANQIGNDTEELRDALDRFLVHYDQNDGNMPLDGGTFTIPTRFGDAAYQLSCGGFEPE